MGFETRAQMITLLATGIYVANTLPAMLLGLVAGVWADRWRKRNVMVASNALRAALVVLAPFCLLPGPVWLGLSWGYWALVLMTLLESVLTQFFAPAEQAAIPLLVPPHQLLAANSVYQATSMAATIVGFALGDPILRLLRRSLEGVGIPGGEFLLLPVLLRHGGTGDQPHRRRGSAAIRPPHFRLGGDRGGTAGVAGTAQRAGGHAAAGAALQPPGGALRAGHQPGGGDSAPRTHRVRDPAGHERGGAGPRCRGHGPARATASTAACWPPQGLAPSPSAWCCSASFAAICAVTLALCVTLGIGAALLAIPAQTTIQEDTPEDQRGKVFGLQNNLINIALSLPLVMAGAVVSRYGLLPVLWGLAVLALVAALVGQPWRRC